MHARATPHIVQPTEALSATSSHILSPEPSTSYASLDNDYESALLDFDLQVKRYEECDNHDRLTCEANIVKALARVLLHRPTTSRGATLRPRLAEWLRIIGMSPTNIRHLELCGIHDVLVLIRKPRNETSCLADRGRFTPESKRKLLCSCEIVMNYLEHLQGRRESASFTDKQLSWSVYSPLTQNKGASWRAASAESSSPPSPRFVLTPVDPNLQETDEEFSNVEPTICGPGSFPGTPSMPSVASHSRSASGSGSLTVLSGPSTLSPSSPLIGSTNSTPALGTNSRIVQSTSMNFGQPVKSPKSSRFLHAIPHKWHRSTKYFLRSDSLCRFCSRPLGFGFISSWEKCRTCKWKVHSHCKNKIPDSCGLTPEHIRLLFDKLIEANNGDMWNDPQSAAVPLSRSLNEPAFQYPDNAAGIVDSSSSTNSSAPSTPALPLNIGALNSPYNLSSVPARSCDRKFTFPESLPEVPDIVLSENIDGNGATSDDHHENMHERVGEDSEGTLVVDSTGTEVDMQTNDENDEKTPHKLDRKNWNMITIRGPNAQASWNEVTIPLAKIDFKQRNNMLGKGRFGYVRRGYHFGDVAVKFLNMDHIEADKRVEQFKSDVVAHKNTRHDNIVLFLGFCMEHENLGIVMSLCKGQSLYRALHESKERMDIKVILQLATQVCQGVSYLHTKNIIHKDLRSKNIFIESNNKIVLTDFGLFSVKRLKFPIRNNSMLVPSHWLAYLAPELIRSLDDNFTELPFSESTDVYAFSTIWYELLTYSFPWAKEHPDMIIWMVGSGMKAPLHNIKAIREVKELLLRCWSFSGADRPSFSEILNLLIALPRKRLDRSPSYPTGRSFESIF